MYVCIVIKAEATRRMRMREISDASISLTIVFGTDTTAFYL